MTAKKTSQTALAYSYIRFSSQRQERGHSVKRQEDAAEAWAKKNDATLDNSTYRDLGVSGFTGAHRQNPDRNGLAMFLKAIEDGKIPKGSFLCVENLDRLTREHIRAALGLFLGILDAGVHIVSLSPERVFRADATGDDVTMDMMIAIVELSRGNRESARKSDMIGKKWKDVRESVREGDLPLLKTGDKGLPCRTPFWVDRTPEGYVLNDKAKAIEYAFQLAKDGYGCNAVRIKVNKQFGLNLSRPYFRELLPNSTKRPRRKTRPRARLVLGEWQPCNKAGQPIGEVIKLYPPAVSEELFHQTQAAITGRDNGGGTRDRRTVYLFNALMRDEHGEGFTVQKTSGGRGVHKFLPKRYIDGKGPCRSFPVKPFETAMFESLKELRYEDVFPKGKPLTDEIMALEGKRDELRALVRDAADAMKPGQEIKAVMARMGQWEREAEDLDRQIAELRQKNASPQTDAWRDVQQAVDLEDPETRVRVRSAVARLVESMTCVFHGTTVWRYAFVMVRFKDSHAFRQVAIWHRAGKYTFGGGRRDNLLKHDTWKEKPIPENDIVNQLDDIREHLEALGAEVEEEEHQTRLAKRREREGAAYTRKRLDELRSEGYGKRG